MYETLLITTGLVLLTFGAEVVVKGASRLASLLGVPSLVVGLTVVAFGTSAPELAVSIASSIRGQADVALGNVVGSNVFNILLILGVSAIAAPLAVDRKIVRFDAPLMVFVSLVAWALAANGCITRLEGICLFGGLVAYTTWHIFTGRKESNSMGDCEDSSGGNDNKTSQINATTRPIGVIITNTLLVIVGLFCLVVGARWFVAGAVEVARHFGVSDLFIGLTVIAGGTSLPELATSVVAALRGERDIAIGNVVGSNIFNILGVLGLASACSASGILVAQEALNFDFPVMVFVALACQFVCLGGAMISRKAGVALLLLYIAYVAALWYRATAT